MAGCGDADEDHVYRMPPGGDTTPGFRIWKNLKHPQHHQNQPDFGGWTPVPWEQHLGAKFQPFNQGDTDERCVGYAVAAALRANWYRHEGRDRGALNPDFLWGMAQAKAWNRDERGPKPRVSSPTIEDALWAANMFGVPRATQAPSAKEICDPEKFMPTDAIIADARKNRLRSSVNLGVWQQDWYSWLRDVGPIVVQMEVETAKFKREKNGTGAEGGIVSYSKPPAAKEASVDRTGHVAVIVGYENSRGWVILNSYGPKWGDRGLGYISGPTGLDCFVSAHGLLIGAQWEPLRRPSAVNWMCLDRFQNAGDKYKAT